MELKKIVTHPFRFIQVKENADTWRNVAVVMQCFFS